MNKIKVLVVDDSKLIQSILMRYLQADPEIEVIGVASNPNEARVMIRKLNPDVLTLDIEMPEMDGITFIEKLMKLHPMPVIMFSSVTQKNSLAAIEALELGAFDYVAKPHNTHEVEKLIPELITKIKQAHANSSSIKKHYTNDRRTLHRSVNVQKKIHQPNVIVIGSSTGGIEALSTILKNIHGDIPAINLTSTLPI